MTDFFLFPSLIIFCDFCPFNFDFLQLQRFRFLGGIEVVLLPQKCSTLALNWIKATQQIKFLEVLQCENNPKISDQEFLGFFGNFLPSCPLFLAPSSCQGLVERDLIIKFTPMKIKLIHNSVHINSVTSK